MLGGLKSKHFYRHNRKMGKANVELEKMQLEQDVMGFNLNTLLNYLNAARTKTLYCILLKTIFPS